MNFRPCDIGLYRDPARRVFVVVRGKGCIATTGGDTPEDAATAELIGMQGVIFEAAEKALKLTENNPSADPATRQALKALRDLVVVFPWPFGHGPVEATSAVLVRGGPTVEAANHDFRRDA